MSQRLRRVSESDAKFLEESYQKGELITDEKFSLQIKGEPYAWIKTFENESDAFAAERKLEGASVSCLAYEMNYPNLGRRFYLFIPKKDVRGAVEVFRTLR